MLKWALLFFVVSIVAGLFGLYELAGLTMDIAQFVIGLFLVLAVIFLGLGLFGYKKAKKAFR